MVKSSTLIGREDELEFLQGKLAMAISGQGVIVVISGNAGIGKTALIMEFGTMAKKAGGLFLSSGCTKDVSIPYRAFINIGSQLTMDEGLPHRTRREWRLKNDDFFSSGDRSRNIETIIDLRTEYCQALFDLSKERPLIIFIDDLQWCDPSSLSLLLHISERLSHQKILVITAYRPEELAGTISNKRREFDEVLIGITRCVNFASIDLNPLSPDETRELVSQQLRGPIDLTLFDSIDQVSVGNPLIILESTRLLESRHALVVKKGVWTIGRNVKFDLPQRIADIVGLRFFQQQPKERSILSTISVYGKEIGPADLSKLLMIKEAQISMALEDLSADRFFLEEKDGQYRFIHGLVQNSIYDSMEASESADLHLMIGQFLEEKGSGEDKDELLSWHFYRAGDFERCVKYSLSAGRKCLRIYALREALEYYSRILRSTALESESEPLLKNVYEEMGDAHRDLMEHDLARSCYHSAINLMTSDADRARIYWKLSEVCYPTKKEDDEWHNRRKYIEMAERCREVAPEDMAEIKLSKAQYCMWDGELDEADWLFMDAESLYEKVQMMDRVAHTNLCHIDLYMTRGDMVMALEMIQRAESILGENRSTLQDVQLHGSATEIFLMKGDREGTMVHGNAMARSAIKLGHHSDTMWANFYMSLANFLEEDFESAFRFANIALDFANLVEAEYSQTGSKCLMSMISLKTGGIEEAQRFAEGALILTDAMPADLNTPTMGLAWAVNGLVHAQLQRKEVTEICFIQATERLEGKRLRIIEAMVRDWYGDVLASMERNADAMTQYQRALGILEGLGNVMIGGKVQRKLDNL